MRLVSYLFSIFCCIIFLTGCPPLKVPPPFPSPHSSPHKPGYKKNGPPPHAPAHGYRHRNRDGVLLQYDRHLGVYMTMEFPDLYFHNGWYLKQVNGLWQVAAHIQGPWEPDSKGRVPGKLKKSKHRKPGKGNKHKFDY